MKSLKQLLAAKGNQVYSIGPDAKVIEALQLMAQKDVGALAVMEGGRLTGMISEQKPGTISTVAGDTKAAEPVGKAPGGTP